MGPLHTGPLLMNKRVSQVVNHHHVKAQWLPSASMFKGEALLLVRDVVSMLITLRNTMSGSVQRVTGKNDVLYLFRLSAGLCLTESCHDVAAVDVVGATLDEFKDAELPILTAPMDARGGGPRALVVMQDKDIFSPRTPRPCRPFLAEGRLRNVARTSPGEHGHCDLHRRRRQARPAAQPVAEQKIDVDAVQQHRPAG